MAQYTTLTKNDIDGIAVNFSVSKINSFNILSGGSENTNYLLNAEKEKYGSLLDYCTLVYFVQLDVGI